MDSSQQPDEAGSLPFQRPHGSFSGGQDAYNRVVPLRLVLRPGGNFVDLDRPEMIVGRHSEADIRLALPDVSRRHCRFVFANNRWQIFDLNSMNGIFVNGDQVKQATIDHGDYIRIGGFVFEAEIAAPAAQTEPADTGDLTRSVSTRDNATCANVLRSIADALPLPNQDSYLKRKAS